MKEAKMKNREWKENKEGTEDTIMKEGKGKSVRFKLSPKATPGKKGGTLLVRPAMTLAQHSANHDKSVANAMKYKEDTATMKK